MVELVVSRTLQRLLSDLILVVVCDATGLAGSDVLGEVRHSCREIYETATFWVVGLEKSMVLAKTGRAEWWEEMVFILFIAIF